MPQILTVTQKTVWSDTLFSFQTTRPADFRFEAGQFVRLGIDPSGLQNTKSTINEPIFRAYSIVSSPYDEFLEFFSVVVPDGAFTSQLQYLTIGDTLLLDSTPYGFLTLSRYQEPAPKDLWLLATGTGLAPFLSILQDIDVWTRYKHIVLAYSVRTKSELAYLTKIDELSNFANLVDNPASFCFVPIATRESVYGTLNKRLPILLKTGELEEAVRTKLCNIKLCQDTSHIMLCGNPQMVEDTKETLKDLGFAMNRRGVGNIAVENYW